MTNKGCLLGFLGGTFFGLILAVALTVGGMFAFKDLIISYQRGLLRPPPITSNLQANYDWEVTSPDGEAKSLSTLRGKVAVVHLFSPDCSNCLAEWPHITALYENTAELEVPIICIAVNKPEKLDEFIAQYNPPFPVYAKTDPVPEIFSENAVPMTFIYAKDGSVALKHAGAAKWDDPSVVSYLKMLMLQESASATP